jgi:hypothetical protein
VHISAPVEAFKMLVIDGPALGYSDFTMIGDECQPGAGFKNKHPLFLTEPRY